MPLILAFHIPPIGANGFLRIFDYSHDIDLTEGTHEFTTTAVPPIPWTQPQTPAPKPNTTSHEKQSIP